MKIGGSPPAARFTPLANPHCRAWWKALDQRLVAFWPEEREENDVADRFRAGQEHR